MQFKKGDKVISIDDNLKGHVISVHSDEVLIETEEGFELKLLKRELIKIEIEQSELEKRTVLPSHLSLKVDEQKRPKRAKLKKKKEAEHTMEVDLHIEKLIKSTKGMDKFDMLTIQLDTAKHKLEFAIRNRIPRVVFIHGVGEGVLKEEIHYLCKRYPVSLSEASYQKYGMGATEVYILQNTKGR